MQHRNVVRFAWTRPFAHRKPPSRCITTSSQLQASQKLRENENDHINERRRRIAVAQDEDQYLLKVVKNRLDNIINVVREAQTHDEAAVSASSKSLNARDRDVRNSTIPRYTIGRNRTYQPGVFSTAAIKTVKAAEKLQSHLEDLQLEPYPNRSRSDLALWAAEMRQWSEERKREELEELRLQEEADRKRLHENTRNLVTFMRELMAAGKTAKAANAKSKDAAVVIREVQTSGSKGGRRRPNFIRPKLSAANTATKKSASHAGTETKAAPTKQPMRDTGGLLEMQSKLISAIRGGSQR